MFRRLLTFRSLDVCGELRQRPCGPLSLPGAAPGDYVLTLEQMVIQGVLPAELATAAARSFGAAAHWVVG